MAHSLSHPGLQGPSGRLGTRPALSHPFGWLGVGPALSHPFGWLGAGPALSPFRVAGHEARSLTLSGGWARSPLSHPFGWLGTKPAFSPFRVAGHEARSLSPWAARAVRVAGRVARSLNELRFGISETPAEAELNVKPFGAPSPADDAAP